MNILGIWDGHDSGVALIRDSKIVFAANEERFTRNKLEIEFPYLAVKEALRFSGLEPKEIPIIAVSTSDFSKTLSRIFPSIKRRYYKIRRRKISPTFANRASKKMKYLLTLLGPNPLLRYMGGLQVRRSLKRLGFRQYKLVWVRHHLAHVATAVLTSAFREGIFLSLDGIGDGKSGMLGTFEDGNLHIMKQYGGRDSLGVFYEHVTNLLNMRELEDEGKVMALASYGYPIADEDNPLLSMFHIKGLDIRCEYGPVRLYNKLRAVLYRYPAEQFAYMAQRLLEKSILKLIENAAVETGKHNLAYAGGVASNIKVNMLLKDSPAISGLYVFPHMGDGGLALGAALYADNHYNAVARYRLDDLFLGPECSSEAVEQAIRASGLPFERNREIEQRVADLIKNGKIVLWFQGRMEYGPRALGNRSILALASSLPLKNKLNIYLKKRVWYQPFCPSMLDSDAAALLEDYDGIPNPFMTVGYRIKGICVNQMIAVINADLSCRPQILTPVCSRYYRLLEKMREMTGHGVILNTSFNKHGEPIINTPEEAIDLLRHSEFEFLALEDFLIWKN